MCVSLFLNAGISIKKCVEVGVRVTNKERPVPINDRATLIRLL